MNLASIDVGLRRIGVSICLDGSTVIPQNAIMRQNRNQAAREVGQFLNEWQINTLIIGIPKDADNSDEMERRIRHFASLIKNQNEIQIEYQDEQGSSIEAKEQMIGVAKQKRDGRIDSIAAQIILQRWLDRLN